MFETLFDQKMTTLNNLVKDPITAAVFINQIGIDGFLFHSLFFFLFVFLSTLSFREL